ncbi:MAG: S9 family peptidase [bacterium]
MLHRTTTLLALLALPTALPAGIGCEPVKPAPPAPPEEARQRSAAAPAGAGQLQLTDLFGPRSLAGRPPRSFQWSADDRRLYYLRPGEKDARVLDLWQLDVTTGKASVLVTAASLRSRRPVTLTEEQKASQERRRVRSRGITRFGADKAGRSLLLPVGGLLHHHDLPTGRTRRLLAAPGGELDPKLSPDGKSVAFVRAGNLFVLDVTTGQQRALTRTGTATLRNGVAEFIAQEELGRHTGHWWSPDGRQIAFAEVDEAPVRIVRRPEFHAHGINVVSQRYPSAGTANAKVRLAVVDVASGRTVWVDLGPELDRYLARVRWVPPGLAVQVLSRDQRTLTLRLADPRTGRSRVVLTERDARYLNLHDDLRPLEKQSAFVWSTETSGHRQLLLYDWSGKRLSALSRRPLFVRKVVGLDEPGGVLYATVPTERGNQLQLYRFALDGKAPPRRITQRAGWHDVTFGRKGRHYVDRFSALNTPPQVRLHSADGVLVRALDTNPAAAYRSHALAQARFVEIPAEDGTSLNGLLLHPVGFDSRRNHPALVYVYGGPHGRSVANRWSRTEPWHHFLAQRGFVVLLVDGRGTDYRGKTFEAKLYQQLGRVDVADVVAAARWLGSRPGIDKSRLGLWGWSYGGYLTVMTLLRTGTLFRAGVAVAPLADWALYDTAYTERYLGHPARAREAYRQSRPMELASSLKTHLLLIHGMADDNVLLQHTLLLAKAFQHHGRRFDLMLYPGKKHSLKGPRTRTHLVGELLGYFQRHLTGP